jgi:hypothetical protein
LRGRVRVGGKLFLLIVFLFVFSSSIGYPFSAVADSSGGEEGPLQVKNQYPIFLHANQPYLEKASMENSLSVSLSHSSTYTVQSSSNWVINLDMEITEFNLRYKRIIRDFLEFDMDIPVLIFSRGFMDGFLESYHNTFGFSDYGRSNRPLNDFLYEIRRDGALVVKGRSGLGLGDIRLAVKKPLISSDGLTVSLKGDLELPVGSAKKGYGNGSVDAGISILLDKDISDFIMTYWNFGAVFLGDVKGYQKVDLKNFVYGGGTIEAALGKGFSLLAQIQGQSAIYPETDLLAVDRAAYLLAIGGRYNKGKGSMELSLTEDINLAGAPDFIVNLTYKLKL